LRTHLDTGRIVLYLGLVVKHENGPARLVPARTRPTETEETVDEHTISPAGDPFTSAASRPTDDTIEAHYASLERGVPCGCLNGVVYIGHLVIGEDGEEVEVFEAVRCRRCADSR
jgi:hypothetical protein